MDAARTEAGTPAAGRDAWRAEAAATTRLALPIVATQLAQVSIMTVDVLFLGRLGPEALAAGALGWNLVFMVTIFGFGICMAAAPMMAQAIGRGSLVVTVPGPVPGVNFELSFQNPATRA